MTTAAAPNQLPESLFAQDQDEQASAPASPEVASEGAPEGAAMTEDGLPQMPPDQLQQALAQQFQQAPAEMMAEAQAEPAAQAPAGQVAQAPAEAAPQMTADPMAQAPAEQMAQAPAEPAVPEQQTYVPQELGADFPGAPMAQPVQEAPAPIAPAQPEAAPMNAEVNGHAVPMAEPVVQESAPQAAAPVEAPAQALEAAPETVLAAMPHPDTYQQMPPATANAEQVVPGLAPEAQSQLAPAARYVPSEAAEPAPMAAPEPQMAEPLQPVEAASSIPDALEALSQPGQDQAAAPMPEMPADPALQAAPAPAQPEAPQAPEAASVAPEAAGVALATDIPAITELPPMGAADASAAEEKPLVLGRDLRQISTVSAEEQSKGGLSSLFSKKQSAEAPAPAAADTGRVSVLGAVPEPEKKKGFSLFGFLSRKKKEDPSTVARAVLPEQPAAPELATPASLQQVPSAAAAAPMASEDSGPVREEIMLFAGKNAETFAESYDSFREGGSKLQISWSTPAFLLSFVWLAYRKLHKFALIGFAFVAGMTLLNGFAALAALLVVMVGTGLYGKSLYAQMMSKKIVEIMQAAGDPNNYVNNLRVQGGVSLPAAVCLGALSVVVVATRVVPTLL